MRSLSLVPVSFRSETKARWVLVISTREVAESEGRVGEEVETKEEAKVVERR